MRIVIAGYGEIGKSIEAIFLTAGHRIEIMDPAQGRHASGAFDALFVCFPAWPFPGHFLRDVVEYSILFKVKAIVIFSTVPIGMTRDVFVQTGKKIEVAHFPVEGKHPNIAQDVLLYDNIVGPCSDIPIIKRLIKSAGIEFTILDNSNQSEFLKLRSLAYYAHAIEFARAWGRWAKTIGVPVEEIKKYDERYNEFHVEMNRFDFTRYVLDPPSGPIGGHCVLNGVRMLLRRFPKDKILEYIDEVNTDLEWARIEGGKDDRASRKSKHGKE